MLPSISRWLILTLLSSSLYHAILALSSNQMADVIAIKEGADLDLNCPIVVQNEDMIISWTCNDEPANIRSSRIHVTEAGKLRIRSAKVGDSCNYRCEAADGFGTLSVITRVIIVDKKLIENLGRPNLTSPNDIPKPSVQYDHFRKTQRDWKKVDENTQQPPVGEKENKPITQQLPGDLEVQVEPANLEVGKNQTFSLECRVSHAINLRQPEIIWLKEFTGRRPDSSNDPQDQSLVIIDGVYYHSLNWPRSITMSLKPNPEHQRASSVLLVRHSDYMHSGRYACFAGYPPYMMSANFSSVVGEHSTLPLGGAIRPIKYKIAVSHVKVDCPEKELKYKQRILGENQEWRLMKGGDENLLISIFSRNSWMRNLTVLLMFICVLLITIKFVRTNRMQKQKEHDETEKNKMMTCKSLSQPATISPDLLEGSLAVKQLVGSSNDTPSPYHFVDSSCSLRPSNYDQECLEILGIPLEMSKSSLSHSGDPTEHVYSEIGAKKEDITSPLEPYYQVPKARNLD